MNGPLEALLGVKFGTLIASVIGAVISLRFIPNLTPIKAFIAIVSGTATAVYVTPIMMSWLALGHEVENAVAFLMGLLGMNVLAGLFALTELFRNNPVGTVRDLKNLRGPPNDR